MNMSRLARRVDAMYKHLRPGRRHWHIGLPAGMPIPDEIQAQLNAQDAIIIREYPAGYIGDDNPIYAWYEEQYLA